MTHNRNDADVAFIKALAELLNENDLTELSVKREYGDNDSLNVRVSRQTAATMIEAAPAFAYHASHGAMHHPAAAPAAQPRDQAAQDPAQHPGAVTSPMVGTVYLAAEPGADPFIAVGTQVSEGQTLLIIEAMKTMNQIPAPRSGIVRRILVTDGSAVEYGAPLVIVE